MKKKLTFLMFSLLLAVGWTGSVSAQMLTKQAAPSAKVHASASMKGKKGAKVPYKYSAIKDLIEAPLTPVNQTEEFAENELRAAKVDFEAFPATVERSGVQRAPRRAVYNETADAVHPRSWYENINYNWTDGNGVSHTSKLTDPATDPYQMAYLVGSTYCNPAIPGIKYSKAQESDLPYTFVDFGWDIASNSRWGDVGTNPQTYYRYPNIVIKSSMTNSNDDPHAYIYSIAVMSGSTTITSYNYATNGSTLPSGWSLYGSWGLSTVSSTTYLFARADSCYITIPASMYENYSNVSVVIRAYHYNYYSDSGYANLIVNGTSTRLTNSLSNYTTNLTATSTGTHEDVVPPTENGYTVFLVKVKDGTDAHSSDYIHTYSWDQVINYFTTFFDGIELLTDGVRVGASTAAGDAGTVFSYTGNLNRFYFISKGKMAYMSSSESSDNPDRAPFYSMYEEFAPVAQEASGATDDFFERMDQGEAYDVVHDCQSVNYMRHFFAMTGMSGTTHNTLSNLLFYIPDDRGQVADGKEWRNYDHCPRVGLYTAELEATATPNKTQEHVYDVTINWSTSLQTILGFDEPEYHDLWVVVKDELNNVVLEELLTTTTDTTYTYQVPQYPESYTIDYIVRAWPTSAATPVDHDANSTSTFYADSDPDDVLIPGYNDFISINRHHYESDFDIDNEYNYYRNFMTLGNQNGTAGLTTSRIDRGENVLHLYRYDYDKHTSETEAARLTFTHTGDLVNWNIDYFDQQYYPKHSGGESKYYLSTMQIPTSGSFTVGSSGGSGSGSTTPTDVTIGPLNTWTTTTSYTVDGVTLSTGGDLGYNTYMRLNGTSTISTASGTITKIVFNGSDTSHPVSNLSTSTGNYSVSSNVGTWTGSASSVSFTSSSYASVTSVVATVETGSGGSGSTVAYDTTYVLVDSINFVYDCVQTTGSFTVNHGNWSSPSNSMYMTSSGAAYINYGGTTPGTAWTLYLQYNCPASLANDNLVFNFGVIDNSTYGSYIASEENSSGYLDDIVQCSSTGRYYSLFTEPLGSGGNVMFYGITPTTTSGRYTNYYSPTIYNVYVYKQVLTEISSEDAPIDVSGIQLVDQFLASTANDTHPYNYGYRLQYTGQNTAEWDTTKVSNVLVVPVKHSGSTLNGFYTFEEMIHDSIPELLETDVKNGDLNMTLGGDAEIFYYTINRKPDNGNSWTGISFMQFDNNHTFYTEGMSYLPQYFGNTNYPGDQIERLDNAEVETGSYNSYMKYGPVVWTYGYDRFYFDADGLPSGLSADGIHNSYGAPVWKTGVGQVSVQNVEIQRQTKSDGSDNPATTWTDENGNTCNLYFLGVNALGELPTTNMMGEGGSNYYEPYMFRVWVKSNSGALRGYTPISSSESDYLVNNTAPDHNMQVVYEEYTNSTTLNKAIPQTYTSSHGIIKFGALKSLQANDVQVIVRFYYKVKHLDPVDNSQDNMVTLDFTANEWQIPVGNTSNWQTGSADYTTGEGDDALTINLANKYYYNEAVGFLMLGQNGTLTLPAFDRKVKQIQVVGRPGASSTVKMNVFVGNDAASTEVTGSTGTSIFDIAEQYQQVGTQYTIKVDNNYNAQIAQVIVIFDDQQTNGMMMRAPMRAAGTTYEKVTSADQLEAGKKYILVCDDYNLALTSTATGNFLAGEDVTINNNTVTIGDNSSIAEFTLGGSVGNWTLALGSNYLNASSGSGNLKLTNNATSWTITNDSGNLNGFRVKHADASRAVIYFSDYSRFGNYAYSNIGDKYSYAWMYVESESTPPTPTAELTAPVSGSTVNVGTNTGNGVSVPVTISGSNLTEDLTVSVSGTGFSVSPATVTAAAANAGVSVTVTYNGTDANATGTLTISSNEVSVTVNLTASYNGGSTPTDDAELITPVDGSIVFVGTATPDAPSVSQVITISGNNLTKDLTASVMGTGFSLLTRDVTVPYADVNAGTASVTVVYSGTAENATGRLTLSSDEVSAVVNLTASYRQPVVLSEVPAGYVVEDSKTPTQIITGIIETLFDKLPAEVISVTYVNSLGMQSSEPFDGINIVVTRYSDGTTTTAKVVR